jgi:hypothetical protein
MGNQALIKGASLAAPKFTDVGAVARQAVSGISDYYLARAAEKRQEERAQKAKVETYLNNMPAGIELSKIPPAQQENVANWSKQMKFQYAEAARVLPTLEAGSEAYVETMSKMTNIKNAFFNLNNNLETFKANKTEYLKSSSSGALSKGNNSKQGNILANIYTDQSDMIFDENGNMAFQSGDQVLNINDVPDYFNKDFKSADTLININSDIYNAGQKLDSTMSNMYRQKILNMIRQGGRETTLSLATDDLIQEGGLGIVDEDLLYNPERQEELEQVVVDNYMNILNSSANAGYQKKQAAIKKSQASSSPTAYKYGQSTRDDLQIYSKPAQKTYSDLKSKIKEIDSNGMNDPIELKVAEVNKILKSNNPDFQDLVINNDGSVHMLTFDKKGDEIVDDEGFSVTKKIDFNDNNSVIELIISSLGSGVGEDAKAILRQQLRGLKPNVKLTGDPNKL